VIRQRPVEGVHLVVPHLLLLHRVVVLPGSELLLAQDLTLDLSQKVGLVLGTDWALEPESWCWPALLLLVPFLLSVCGAEFSLDL
jgi:hypothetical protein